MAEQMLLTIGGCAANAAVDLCKMGVRSAVVGRVGGDVFGGVVRDMLRGHGVAVCAQPVAEVLYRAHVLVEATRAVATTEQEFGQRVEECAERIGAEPADVMGSSKEFFEHGCPPRDRE